MRIHREVDDLEIIRPGALAEEVLGVSKATLWRMRRRGEIPEPLRISRGAVGWRKATIRRWLDEREAEANGGAAD